jgi:hypothetical protein
MPSSTSSASTVSSTNAEPGSFPATALPPSAARHRGCTRPGRLARLDAFLCLRESALIRRDDGAFRGAPFVDLGIGEWPWTTLETAHSLRALAPSLRIVGVERDAQRLRNARRFEAPGLEFREGGFDLPLTAAERPRLVRALNVLREYSEAEARSAHAKLGSLLLPSGLLLEGTSSASGGVCTVHLLRKSESGALEREGLVFLTDFSQGFAPFLFRDRLPRDLRRRCEPGSAIHAFLRRWTDAFHAARSTGLCEPEALFALSAQLLSARLAGIVCEAGLQSIGALLWQPPGGVP